MNVQTQNIECETSKPAGATRLATATLKLAPASFDLESTRFPIDVSLLSAPQPLRHVLPGLLEGTLGLFAGPGGKGKTMLLLQIAVAVAGGLPICGGLFDFGVPELRRAEGSGKVVLLLAEETAHIVSARLHAILRSMAIGDSPLLPHKADLDMLEVLQQHLVILPCADHGRPMLLDREGRPTGLFRRLKELCEGARLVLLDPLRQLHSGDEIDAAYMTDVMSLLRSLVAGSKGAALVAHHTSQAASVADYGERAQAARGTTAITDAVRFQLNLSSASAKWLTDNGLSAVDPERLVRVDVAKANHLPPMPTQLLIRGAGGVLRMAKKVDLGVGAGPSSSRKRAPQSWVKV